MAPKAYDIHAVQFGIDSFGEITNQGMNPNLKREIGTGSGQAERPFAAVLKASPEIRFTSKAIETALNSITTLGDKVDATNKIILFMKAFEDGAVREAGLAHQKIEADDGYIYPSQLRASDGEYAELDVIARLCERTGDGTSPITDTPNSALTGDVNQDEFFTLGDVTINGTLIDLVQSINVDFGITPLDIGGSGLIYAKGIAAATIEPVITIQTQDANVRSIVGANGLALTTAVIKLRQVDKNAATSYTTGMSLTISGGLAIRDDLDGQHAQQGMQNIILEPTKVGANDLIAIGSY